MRVPPGWEGLSDEELALRSRQEPKIVFEVLFERHRGMIYSFLSRQISDRERVEDLFQTVFMKVYRGLPNFKMQSRFKTWIYTIASNVVTDEFRSRGRRRPTVELNETMAMAEPGDMDRLDRADRMKRVKSAIEGLPDGLRKLFTLVRFQELKIAEAAEVLGMTPSAAKVALFRAQKKIGEAVLSRERV